MKSFELDHSDIPSLDCLRVYCSFAEGRDVSITKITIYHNYASSEQNITVAMLADQFFMKELIRNLEDWIIGYEFEQMNRPRGFNPDGDAA